MTLLKVPYRIEKPIHNSQVGISLQTEWRMVPLFLHEMKRVNLSIYKAKLHESWTTLYINSTDPETSATIHRPHLINALQGRVVLDPQPLYLQGLHPNTTIMLYNIPNCPYTILDVSCMDRTGLFCEMLEFLAPYDVQIHHAHCNAHHSIAANVFFITDKQGNKLSPELIEYYSNMMEYDLKKRMDKDDIKY